MDLCLKYLKEKMCCPFTSDIVSTILEDVNSFYQNYKSSMIN